MGAGGIGLPQQGFRLVLADIGKYLASNAAAQRATILTGTTIQGISAKTTAAAVANNRLAASFAQIGVAANALPSKRR